MDRVMKLTYSSSLTRFREMNPSFDIAKLRIAYHGNNRNGSYIAKDAFERAIPSMYNCPVVCNYDRETDSIGSHDIELVRDDNGSFRLVNITTPVGVVPESAEWFWEEVTEADGETHEYLTTEILLWKRQEAYKKISEDGIEAQSMEIEVKDGKRSKEKDVFVIEDFSFTAFCLLGENTEPCFESADVEVYSSVVQPTMEHFKEQLEQMMADLKETYSVINSPVPEVEIKDNLTEGGEVLDDKLSLVQTFGLNIDELDFALDDLTIDELREKLESLASVEAETPVGAASVDAFAEEQFALDGNLRDCMREAVAEIAMHDTPWGQCPKFWFVDFDQELMEVYAESEEDWHLYGFNFSLNGDNVVIDADSQKRMKWVIAEFDEGDEETPFANMFGLVSSRFTESENAWSEKVQAASDTIEALNNELTDLRKFKNDTIEADKKVKRDGVFESFTDLNGIEAFEKLRDNCAELSIEEIEEKCFAIRGRENTKVNFAREIKAPKIKVGDGADTKEPYGGAFIEYGVAE